MLEELERLTGITDRMRLPRLPPVTGSKDAELSILEKAYLMQVRLDLEAKVEAASWSG
jgi:hypothetical protein